jgi:hypothetical protein
VVKATAWGRRPQHLIRDRDAVYGGDFAKRAAALGIEPLLTPVRSPRANAIAERVIRTLRQECLDRLMILGPRHLEQVLREYVGHYNAARPHRALGLRPPLPRGQPVGPAGPVLRHDRLGGLLHEYYRCAACLSFRTRQAELHGPILAALTAQIARLDRALAAEAAAETPLGR